ncbi:MAG: glutamine--fructose-6-phosphate transaminase (isomerizing) [Planctomycetota bacterium]
MCGIVGAIHREAGVLESLLEGLRTLEYRGYDSVGVGVVHGGRLCVQKRAGRIDELVRALAGGELAGVRAGIGHSRWATHGAVTDENAHPHTDVAGELALVHNGIVENHRELRTALEAAGFVFRSETDTEVLAHLVAREIAAGRALAEAVRRALAHVRGYYAIAVLVGGDEPQLVGARQGPPLCVGATPGAGWLASDVLALLPHTRDVFFLEDGDVAEVAPGRIAITDAAGKAVERPLRHIEWQAAAGDKGAWPHFMLKEIHEQPDVVARTAYPRLGGDGTDVRLEGGFWTDESLRRVSRVQTVACGTALHAGLVARYMLEGLGGVPADAEYASEFRYRDPLLDRDSLVVAISQSGETADTLAAMRLGQVRGGRSLAICNSIGSTMVREAEASFLIDAGPEIGVASTKAFVAMLVAAYLIAVRIGRARGHLAPETARERLEELRRVPAALEHLLAEAVVARVREMAHRHAHAKGFLFLGRGINYPIALEGALKLKEISYVHAEGYPAGEMKHGPIALIEPGMTTVVVAPRDGVVEKLRSNVEQVRARGGHVIAVGSDPECLAVAHEAIEVPDAGPWLSPVLDVVPLQLFAYHVAEARGCDIDKPRNLAKSVTVE